MDTQKHLRVLVVEDSINAAQELLNVVRNLGHAVRESRADDPETLLLALNADQFDVVFSATTVAALPLKAVRGVLDRQNLPIPLLAHGADLGIEAQVAALREGAVGLVSKDAPEHLELVLSRELGRLAMQRRLLQTESALAASERRCQALLESSKEAVAYVLDGMHIYANQVYLELFGFKALADIEGTPIMDMVEEEDRDKLRGFLGRYGRGEKRDNELDLRGIAQSGAKLNISMEFSDATYEEEECIQVVIRDYTATRRLENQVADLISRDQLTGLYNRQYFVDALEDTIESPRRKNAGLIYAEIDGIAGIRERLGLSGTDVVLREVAAGIATALGERGIAARLSDAAFTVLLVEGKDVAAVADGLVQAIAGQPVKVDGKPVSITVSAGSARLKALPNEPDAALDAVEQACADARVGGGNAHRAYRIARERYEDHDDDEDSKELARRVRDAITSRRLKLLFQPIAILRGEGGEKYESQLRMVNENGDLIHPRQFMAAAIRYQLAPSLDRWVLLNTLARSQQRQREKIDTVFFVKISPPTLLDAKFAGWLKEHLDKSKVSGAQLVLEASETSVLEHLAESKNFQAAAAALGCGFAIDNFGISSGALKLLKHFPADYVRIHGELISRMHEDDNVLRKVRDITHAVGALNKTTIATHVDDSVVLPVLWQAGVDLMQGAFLQEPGEGLTFDFVGEMF